ncbi:hypothetical protein DB345_04965 [Spartobacteria bacterium LR76]|nr:hypothetical protein DB345_04965 [Spartobacteria bacterium LR76]
MARASFIAIASLLVLQATQGQDLRPERSPIEMLTMLSYGTLLQDFSQVIAHVNPAAEIQLLSYGHAKIIAFSIHEMKDKGTAELIIAILDISRKNTPVSTRQLRIPLSTFESLKKLWSEELRRTAYHDAPPSTITTRDALFYHLAIQTDCQSYAGYFTSSVHPTAFTTRIITIVDAMTELAETPHLTPEAENKLIARLAN